MTLRSCTLAAVVLSTFCVFCLVLGRILFLSVFFSMALAGCQSNSSSLKAVMNASLPAPVAQMQEKILHTHKDLRIDPYYWLRSRENPAVLSYLQEENRYTDSVLAPLAGLRELLFQELKSRVKEEDQSYPVFDNGYYYYTKTKTGGEYYVVCRRKQTMEAPEEIILDVDELAKGHVFFAMNGWSVSPDNDWVVYGADTLSRRQYNVHLKQLSTGKVFDLHIHNTSPQYVWAADSKTFLYVKNNPNTLLTESVFAHRVGDSVNQDRLLYHEKDTRNYLSIDKSKSGQYLFIVSANTLSSEVLFCSAMDASFAFQVFAKRRKDVLYSVEHQGERFVILTNQDAKNFQLMDCPLEKTSSAHWRTVIPGSADRLLEHMDVFRDFVAVSLRDDKGLRQINVLRNGSPVPSSITFHQAVYDCEISSNPVYEANVVRYEYSSLSQPYSLYDYTVESEKSARVYTKTVPNYSPDRYEMRRIFVTARDGVKIPVSLLYKKGTDLKSGKAPLLLYGYGAYGITIEPSFRSSRATLVDHGFIFAIAHIRGGEDLGGSGGR